MRVVKMGDQYRPKDGEVLVLVVDGKQIVCRVELVHETREDGRSSWLCQNCPLRWYHLRSDNPTCWYWLMFEHIHKVIPVEEDIE